MTIEVDVLGTKYSIVKSDKAKDVKLENLAGYCDSSVNQIVIDTFKTDNLSKSDLNQYEKEVIRHELVHAFLIESGLDDCSWGGNEEIVDWIAKQFPKMLKVFEELNVI
jgi:hypothetical protein